MVKPIIALADPVTTLVNQTNQISVNVGDPANLANIPGSADSDLVQAINAINSLVLKTDSDNILSLVAVQNLLDSARAPAVIRANSYDSAETQALINTNISANNSIISSLFQKDSANGIGFDSSEKRFFIPTGTVNSSMLENSAVIHDRIAADAVDSDNIADNAINSEHYTDLSIDTAHIGNLQVTAAKLAADAVETAKIDDLAVTNAKIANTTIENGKIADNQITSAKFSSAVTIQIKDVAGNVLKTIRSPGS